MTPRKHTALTLVMLLTLPFAGASCKRLGTDGNANAAHSTKTTAAGETAMTPPFSTKEPERYQATMVIQGSLGGDAVIPGRSGLTTKEMLVARDGEQRRVDTEIFPGLKVAYLQTAAGRYLLVPARKIYAELKPGSEDAGPGVTGGGLPPDFAPDKLLNQSPGGARYEELGKENLNGRETTKYRVTMSSTIGEAKHVTTESLIWIDAALGMPVKSETTVSGGSGSGSKYSTEMRDLKQEVDATVFALPPDYKQLDYKELSRQLTESALDSMVNKK